MKDLKDRKERKQLRLMKDGQGEPPLLTVPEVARQFNVSDAWVYRHSSGNDLPTIPHMKIDRTIRFRQSEIEKFLQENTRRSNPTGTDGID